MKSFTIRQIIDATRGKLLNDDPDFLDASVSGVSTDSRTIKKGQLFIPLVGEIFDGHFFLDQVAEKGATAVLVHREDADWLPKLFPDVAAIKVPDTLKALQDLASFQRSRFDIPVVAITGSNGKTTTKDMIGLVLSKGYSVLKTQGNLNNEIGLPLTLLEMDDHHQVMVVEMGMNNLGEIHRLAEIARPTIAVITNIGVSHLQNLGTRENILKAKLEVSDFLGPKDWLLLNGDDEYLGCKVKGITPMVEYFGTREGADIRAQNINILGEVGVSYDLLIGSDLYPMKIPVPGKHNVYNSLAAVSVGNLLDIEIPEIQNALEGFRSGDMRLNILNTESGLKIIDDVYNASPDSMTASIEILKDVGGKRKIAVLGDMLELGEYSKEGHLRVGKVVAQCGIDHLITVGQDSKFIGEGALDFKMADEDMTHLECNKDVMVLLNTMLEAGDTILVKGSRGLKMEEIVQYLTGWERDAKGENEQWTKLSTQ
ncbi:MAG TPA: UDP-N-acetylmuramoyl-tripeptide--D-alanyl-D-alanine ligase [Clostridia bacterium]|nr:UDP-N-acetylmuramoyl-tripeptide--D-alanyl-D-alanine ligase [Clostridia bacterium]